MVHFSPLNFQRFSPVVEVKITHRKSEDRNSSRVNFWLLWTLNWLLWAPKTSNDSQTLISTDFPQTYNQSSHMRSQKQKRFRSSFLKFRGHLQNPQKLKWQSNLNSQRFSPDVEAKFTLEQSNDRNGSGVNYWLLGVIPKSPKFK